jgi:hypothetical protein
MPDTSETEKKESHPFGFDLHTVRYRLRMNVEGEARS